MGNIPPLTHGMSDALTYEIEDLIYSSPVIVVTMARIIFFSDQMTNANCVPFLGKYNICLHIARIDRGKV